jgi:hypothetical protein
MENMLSAGLSTPVTAAYEATSGGILAPAERGIVALGHTFDFRKPNYDAIWKARIQRLAKLRDPETGPAYLKACKVFYASNIPQFIDDWGVTVDPRNAAKKLPVIMPFVLFPKQREFLEFVNLRYRTESDGVLVKSRDCGASWLAMGWAATMCLFHNNLTFGFGSATEDKVDKSGDPDCLFYKGRMFLRYLPREFKGGWDVDRKDCSTHRTLAFPATECSINGEIGDKIGRGGRKTVYFVDEFAFVERPKLVDANLIANTNCRIEMSSVNGLANVFAERARGGLIERFDFHYRDDPRKVNKGPGRDIEYKRPDGSIETVHVRTGELYPDFQEKKRKSDPVTWNQEYEADFMASAEGVVIPQEWVQAAVDAHVKLGIVPTGTKSGSFDVADQGKDKCCYVSGYGILVRFVKSWSGQGSQLFKSVEQAYEYADLLGDESYLFDGDGMGAGVSSDVARISERRKEQGARTVTVGMFRGSGKVIDPTLKAPGTDRKNEDFFENYKAQCWWSLRQRFYKTFQAVTGELKPGEYDPDELISLSSEMEELSITCAELSQPVRTWSKAGKMVIDKTPDDVRSPNNADSIMMRYPYARPAMNFNDDFFAELAGQGGG